MTGPDPILYIKDINQEKKVTRRVVDPLNPQYAIPTRSGRMITIGPIEKNYPKANPAIISRRHYGVPSQQSKAYAFSENQSQVIANNAYGG